MAIELEKSEAPEKTLDTKDPNYPLEVFCLAFEIANLSNAGYIVGGELSDAWGDKSDRSEEKIEKVGEMISSMNTLFDEIHKKAKVLEEQ